MNTTASSQACYDETAHVKRRSSARPDATTLGYTSSPAFEKHFSKLAEIMQAPVEGREPPSHIARTWARLILEQLQASEFEPTKVTASADGGITICFVRGDLYCDLECLNNGDVLGVTTNRQDRPTVWTINSDFGSVPRAVDRIRQYLHTQAAKKNAPQRPWYRRWL